MKRDLLTLRLAGHDSGAKALLSGILGRRVRHSGEPVIQQDLPTARTILVRAWHEPEPSEPNGGEWRGEVRDLLGNRSLSFRKLENLCVVLKSMLNEQENDAH